MAFQSQSAVTPLYQQYLALKAQVQGYILFYQLGDFYELFAEDAETAARELDLVLTSRNVSRNERIPMAGVPVHAAEPYIQLIVKAGYAVAVIDQCSVPDGSGLVERRITRLIEPGMSEAKKRG
jgi:DNA mismatch repair protein MutS